MNMSHKSAISFAGVAAAALLLAVASPRTVHSVLAVPITESIVPEKDTESDALRISGLFRQLRRFNSQRLPSPVLPG